MIGAPLSPIVRGAKGASAANAQIFTLTGNDDYHPLKAVPVPDHQFVCATLRTILGKHTTIFFNYIPVDRPHADQKWMVVCPKGAEKYLLLRCYLRSCTASCFIPARILRGTLATTLYLESTSSVMSYFRIAAKRIATSLSLSL
jgi:hypothetical protein